MMINNIGTGLFIFVYELGYSSVNLDALYPFAYFFLDI